MMRRTLQQWTVRGSDRLWYLQAGSLWRTPRPSITAMCKSGPVHSHPTCGKAVFEDDNYAWLFTEHLNLRLSQDEIVNAVNPGVYDADGDLGSFTIPQGTVVNVYLLHSDPIGEPNQPRVYQGSITFPFQILGVIARGRRLRLTDPRLGVSGTQYAQSDNYRGYELGDWSGRDWGPERFRISDDGYTLEFACGTTTVVDELRILTAVPEPASLLVLSAGVAGLAGLRRWRR
jgi:hypothetical protein